MTPYYAPPGYALVYGGQKYHLVAKGTDVTICPSALPARGVKRVDRVAATFKVCRKCKYYWSVNNDN
jgi:hypothetical protein